VIAGGNAIADLLTYGAVERFVVANGMTAGLVRYAWGGGLSAIPSSSAIRQWANLAWH